MKEETPVLTVIEPITIPNEKYEPKPRRIMILWILLGIISSLTWIFSKKHLYTLKDKWKEN